MTSSPLRIFVLRGVDGAGGGADKIILRTAAQAEQAGLRMRVCFMRHREDPDYDFDQRSRDLGLDYAEVLHSGAFDRGVLPQLLAQVREFRPDVLHSHDYKANFYARLLGRRVGTPRISTSHGWTGHGLKERWIYYPADKLILSRFDARIAVSNEIRSQLLRYGAPQQGTHVVLNGVDPAAYQRQPELRKSVRDELGYTDEHLLLGAVGRVETQKRFDLLLRAFQDIIAKVPHARLLIAGDGSLLESLRADVLRLKLEDTVRVMGHCADMKRIYQGIDRLVQSSDYEGTPTVVVEAMAMQIPVIATDAGGTAQLLEHEQEGWIVPIRQPRQLAEAVIESIASPELADGRAERARQRVESELSFEHRMQRLADIYRTLTQ